MIGARKPRSPAAGRSNQSERSPEEMRMDSETAMRSAGCSPKIAPKPLEKNVESTLVRCPAIHRPGPGRGGLAEQASVVGMTAPDRRPRCGDAKNRGPEEPPKFPKSYPNAAGELERGG